MSRGHGWVTKNADGFRARCGGPAMCMTCRREQIALVALARPQTPTRPAWYWVQDVHTYDVLVRDPAGTEYEITGNMLSDTPAAVQRVLNATLDALTKPPIEPPAPLVADLAALVSRLAYAVGKDRANPTLREQAMAFLRSHGLESEPLREDTPR